jgi:hypothetical protein
MRHRQGQAENDDASESGGQSRNIAQAIIAGSARSGTRDLLRCQIIIPSGDPDSFYPDHEP